MANSWGHSWAIARGNPCGSHGDCLGNLGKFIGELLGMLAKSLGELVQILRHYRLIAMGNPRGVLQIAYEVVAKPLEFDWNIGKVLGVSTGSLGSPCGNVQFVLCWILVK